MATLKRSKRADGLYKKSIVIGRKPDGKPIRKYIYATTIKELERKTAEYERQFRCGTLSADENATFGKLAELWISSYKPTIEAVTRNMYESVLRNHLLPDLANMKFKDLKPHHLQSIINDRASKGYAEQTLRKIKITASQIVELALTNDIVFRNVFEKVTVPHIEREERRILTTTEVDLVTSTWVDHRMGLPVMIMLYCGLRRGEVLALTWGDIDINEKLITVNKAVTFNKNHSSVKAPKSKAGRRKVPIPDMIMPYLRNSHRGSLLICPATSGALMTQSAFKRAWESYMHFLNIKSGGRDASRSHPKLQVIQNITPHMLRHTYATLLYDAGVDIKSAQKFLGHAEVETTLQIYTHLSEQKEQSAVDALNAHLNHKRSCITSIIKNDGVKMG